MVAVFLAWRSVAFPVALAGLPAIAVFLHGSNPFPVSSVAYLTGGWVGLALVFSLLRGEHALPLRMLVAAPVLLTLALLMLMVLRLPASPLPEYGSYKLQLFAAKVVPFLVGGIVVARSRKHFELWLPLALVASVGSGLALLSEIAHGQGNVVDAAGRLALFAEPTSLELGRQAALGLLVGAYLLVGRGALPRRTAALSAALVLASAVAAASSRTPTLGLVVGLVLLIVLSLDGAARRWLALVAVAAVGAALLVPHLVPGQDPTRPLSALLGSANPAEGIVQAWRALRAHPLLGVGTGGFHTIAGNGDLYPHDIVLEAGAELGIIGLLLVLGIVVFGAGGPLRAWRQSSGEDRGRAALVLAFLGCATVDSVLSGSLENSRMLWLAIGLGLGLAPRPEPLSSILGGTWGGDRSGRRRQLPADEPPARPRMAGVGSNCVGGVHDAPPGEAATGVALRELAELLSGTIELQASAGDEEGVEWVEFQCAAGGSFEWKPLGWIERPPFALAVDTSRLPDGAYDFRAFAARRDGGVDGSRPARGRLVDNTLPSVSLQEPPSGAWLRGAVGLTALAEDEGSGVASVVFQFSVDEKLWRPVVGPPRENGSVRWDTSRLDDGEYLLRAVAIDAAGNLATGEQAPVRLDNTPPRVVLVEPSAGASLRGAVAVRAEASDGGSGVVSLRLEATTGVDDWHEVGSADGPTLSLVWDTRALPDGIRRLRCVARDRVGNSAPGAETDVLVENAAAPAPPLPRAPIGPLAPLPQPPPAASLPPGPVAAEPPPAPPAAAPATSDLIRKEFRPTTA